MAKMTRFIAVFVLAGFCCVTFAQQETQTPTNPDATKAEDEKRSDIMKLMEVTGAGKNGMAAVQQMIAMQRQSNPNVPKEFWDEFLQEIDPNELVELSVPSWNKHFDHEDIKGLLEFYSTPLGRKLIEKQPLIMQESMVAGQKWGMELGQRIGERLQSNGFKP